MLTGGGPLPKIKKDETDDLLMSIINKKTLVGLENPFDDDVEVAVIQANKDINSDIVFEYVMEVDDETQNLSSSSTSKSTLIDQCDNQALPEKRQVLDSDLEVLAKDKFEDHNHISWKKFTPKQLQIPISTPLAYPVKDSSEKYKETPKTNNNRRRPTTIIKPMTSSDVAKKYDMLLDKRSKLIDMQLKHMEEEHQLLMRKRSLEVEILRLELKNKKIEQL